MSSLLINRLVSGVTALGPGRRFGIWVQGCALACPGCASVDTWARDGGQTMSVDELAAIVLDAAHHDALAGITITGGEPVDQAGPLSELLDAVSADPDGAGLDILVFTGYPLQVARRRGPTLLARADTVVAGPYREGAPSRRPLLASANQELIHLTDRGERRHHGEGAPTIQVMAHDGELLLVGLPMPGDLDRLHAGLSAQGVRMEAVSWTR